MDRPIELRSDNAAGVAPEILAAVAAADEGSALAYGGDEWTARLRERVAEVFEHPDVTVFPVVSGTAANALGLSALCPPWGAVLCHESAHILNSEGGATSLLGGGAVMRGLPGPSFRIDARRGAGSARRDPLGRPAPLAAGGGVAHLPDGPRHDLQARRGPGHRRRRPPPLAARAHGRRPHRQRRRRPRLHAGRPDVAGRRRRRCRWGRRRTVR